MESESTFIYNTIFRGTRFIDNMMFATNWSLEAELHVIEDIDSEYFNYYLDKINFFIDEIIQNSIFIDLENDNLPLFFDIENAATLNNNVVLLPDDATDMAILYVLQKKLFSLSNGKIYPTTMILKSDNDKKCNYKFTGHIEDTELAPDWINDHSWLKTMWWNRNDISTFDLWGEEIDSDLRATFTKNLDDLLKSQIVSEQENTTADIIRVDFKPKLVVDNSNKSKDKIDTLISDEQK